MTFLTAILAAAGEVDPLATGSGLLDLSTPGGKVVLGAIILVLLGAAIWIIYAFGQPRRSHSRRHRKHRHRHHEEDEDEGGAGASSGGEDDPGDDAAGDDDDEDSAEGHRKRRRRRRRQHRPRNPTLAETGGLPPIRTEPPPGP